MSLAFVKPSKPAPVLPETFKRDTDNPSLLELVLKYVYCETLQKTEPERDRKMSLSEENLMKYSIDWWHNAIKRQKEHRIIKFLICQEDEIREPDEVELCLMKFSSLIIKKEEKDPILMRRIANYREKKIDYRRVYNLPGAHTVQDFIDAHKVITDWNQKNPDLT